jgi:hypothetical protein
MGTLVGSPMEHLKDLPTIYEELFASTQPQLSPGHTGSVHGLALGIAGAFTSHLLYRLLHGEATGSRLVSMTFSRNVAPWMPSWRV